MVRHGVKSDLYQVDFVAALFGAFLLLWISGIGRGNTTELMYGTTFLVEVWGDQRNDMRTNIFLPFDAAQQCADKVFFPELDHNLPVKSCASDPTDHSTLAGFVMSDDISQTSNTIPSGEIFAQAVLADLTFLRDGRELPVSFSGFALNENPNRLMPDTGAVLEFAVAVGSMGELQPDAVRIRLRPEGVAVVCKSTDCKDERPKPYTGQASTKATQFGIVVRSKDWDNECLEHWHGNFDQDLPLKPCKP